MIDYLQEENRVLRAGLRGKRLRLSDDDRRRLAVKAQALGREALAQIASVATPATLLRWYRCLIAAKYPSGGLCSDAARPCQRPAPPFGANVLRPSDPIESFLNGTATVSFEGEGNMP